ncbi:alpha/beta hydrolase [Bordetella sp. BOR01]|uniref:alpha/beta hydrolase n=1 Tax=Bordetella sp. BOR01 TaxID=2854779 RepID=UPI00351D6FE0
MTNSTQDQAVESHDHWSERDGVKLFLRQKFMGDPGRTRGIILFVHGSSMASTPTFDLQVPGRPYSSAMDWFARQGFDTWCVDMEGYGRSSKDRSHKSNIATGAANCAQAADYIASVRGNVPLHLYGISSGALRAALFAQNHPERVGRLALDAFVYTGEGSPTLADRRKKMPQFEAADTRPIDRKFVHSIFERDHPGTADAKVVDCFADAILALDSEMPNGTYIDMCAHLPVVDPARITAPTIIMRGEYDGIASLEDLLDFYCRLPNADKQFAIMPGIAHASFQQKNYMMVYHILHSFLTQPAPVYRG